MIAGRFSGELEAAYSYVDSLCLHLCFHVARECRLLATGPRRLDDLIARVAPAPEAVYLLTTVLDILAEEGYVTHGAGGWEGRRPVPPDRSGEIQREAREACPAARAIFELIERCHDHAPAFVSGREPGLSAVFPHRDFWLWERLHTVDAVMLLYADLIPPALEAVAVRGARLLELGGGVGAVIRRCVSSPRARGVREYWFTDLGKVFVQRARTEFGGDTFMRFATVDLNRPLPEQGFEPESLDVVNAVNVLQLARDLVATLSELRAVLKDAGHVICAEGSPPDHRRHWRADLIFAFLRGWWDVSLHETSRRRPGFLLPSEWENALHACGYANVVPLPGEAWFSGPCRGGLIIAGRAA